MSEADTPTTPIIGQDVEGMTKKQFEDAAEDARILMTESPIIPKLVMVDIVARRLFLMVRSAMQQELEQGWDVENVDLVLQTLGMSAQEKAVDDPGTPADVQQQLFSIVIPVVDIFVQMQAEAGKQDDDEREQESDKGSEVLLGGDAQPADELGDVLCGAGGDAEQQAGECGEGDREEEG